MRVGVIHQSVAKGFTLVEVLIGMAVIAVGILSLMFGFRQSFAVVQVNRENLRATQILQEKTEMLRLYTWDQVTNGAFIPTNFSSSFNPAAGTNNTGVSYSGTVTVTNAPITETYSTDLRQVTISLTWTNGGEGHTRSMVTFISRYGLQNYIY
jgi:prepilin-type N-terminal cleavage/methylation domain-containing protein